MLLILSLSACTLLLREEEDPLTLLLAEVDAAWAGRVEQAELDRSGQLALMARVEAPQSPEVLWRLARTWNAQAWGAPVDAEGLYLEARTFGLDCLATSTGYASRVEVSGGLLVPRAVRQVQGPQRACLEPVLVAWVRWVELRGPAAALDLTPITLLAERALELDPDAARWEGPWARGMVELLRPGPAPRDLALARRLLVQAIEREPQLAIAHLDLARYGLVLGADAGAWRTELRRFEGDHPPDQDGPWARENRVARMLAAQALQDGEDRWAPAW